DSPRFDVDLGIVREVHHLEFVHEARLVTTRLSPCRMNVNRSSWVKGPRFRAWPRCRTLDAGSIFTDPVPLVMRYSSTEYGRARLGASALARWGATAILAVVYNEDA
ncbi:MAG: hypothetical protein ACYTFG_00925, partial [Planctomycetota bacterium]